LCVLVTARRSGSGERGLHAAVEETRLHRAGRVSIDGAGDGAFAWEASQRERGGGARRFAAPTGHGRVDVTREIFLETPQQRGEVTGAAGDASGRRHRYGKGDQG